MDLFCWNIRGFNDSVKRRGFRKWIRKNNPIFGGLVETHVQPNNASSIINRTLPGWSSDFNYEFSELGKIWLLWHPSVQVTILFRSLQMVCCRVKLPRVSSEMIISIVYGSNCRIERRELWSDVELFSSSPLVSTLPWIIMGDFNEILTPTEHSSMNVHSSHRGMRDFSECLKRSDIFDLPWSGNAFTWSNRHILKKLDRILSNDIWPQVFPNSIGVFGDFGISDHSPCCVFLDQQRPKQKRPFKFFSHLNLNPEFLEIIKGCWNNLSFEGSRQLCVSKKLKELKSIIRSFSKTNYSNLEKRVQEAFDSLILCQQATLLAPSLSTAELEREAHSKWSLLAKAEDSFLKQRSRVQWSSDGDANTCFYHRSIKTRRDQNQIDFFMDNDDNVIDSLPDIKNHAVEFYTDLLGGMFVPSTSSASELSDLFPMRCSPESKQLLAAPFSRLDIQKAFFSLPKNKAPGPDGYPGEFFTANWGAVGNDMIDGVLEFLTTGKLLRQWNSTILTLTPKKSGASRITDFRPIACCNTVYKVASKLLANRLKSVLPMMISSAQSAFIPGRLLVENVLLATEMVQGYNLKSISKRCMLKVDLKKAFDTLSWDFIMNTMEAMEFPEGLRNLIKQCITSASYSVAINGELCGYFKGTRGLRQGDPLSPYLFVLSIEVFSQMLSAKYEDGSIGFHPNAMEPAVTHLAFADDIMVFSDGEKKSLECISSTFDTFAAWSGLNMNKDKTELFLAGMTQNETLDISSLGFKIGSLPVRYLGLPLMHRQLRISDYRPLLEKVSGCLNSWSAKALSYAGRCQLLSSVIYGTIIFWASAFILPKGCINKIQSMCTNFLWGGRIDQRSTAKISWKTICLPKSEGGLGLRDFGVWNKTLCLKLIWIILTKTASLWADWVKSYRLNNRNFWSIDEDKQTSPTLRSLLRLRPLAAQFIRTRVGSGSATSFWWDHWTPLGPLIRALGQTGPRDLMIPLSARVCDACNDTGWLLRGARSDAALELQTHLTTIHLPMRNSPPDLVYWYINNESLEAFSASRVWDAIRHREPPHQWTASVWFNGRVPRHAFNFWIAYHDRLPTKSRLAAWGINISTACILCNSAMEDRDHMFLRCPTSEVIWACVLRRLEAHHHSFHTWTTMMD